MLSLPTSVRIFLARGATDMRKSIDGLAAVTTQVLERDPLSGHLFVFCNGRRDRIKILYWERSGFWLLHKRLEQGTFAWPLPEGSDEKQIELPASDLAALLGGLDLREAKRRRGIHEIRDRENPLRHRPRVETTVTADANELERLRARVAELEASNAALSSNNVALAHRVEMLLHQLYSKRAERREGDHPTLPFPGDEPEPPPPPHVDEAEDDEYETITYTRKKRGATRISKDLPRETIVLDVPEAERKCPCCGDTMQEIGREVSERLDFVPAVTKVIETVRPKYACKKHEECGVRTAQLPVHPIARGMATAGLIAHVLVAKYKDHLPLYRQSCIFARHGAEIPESTLGDWVKDAVELLAPVVHAMRASVLESAVVQSDDTPVLVLDRAHPEGRKRGFLWAYVGDRDEVVFDFTPGRSREGPKRFLGDYRGILQADAYSGYDHLYVAGRIVEAGCMAHGRRGFVKAEVEDKVNAGHAIAAIRRLYAVERDAQERGLGHDARRELRQRESLPVLNAMKPWLEELKKTARPKSLLGKAVGYFLNQWDALCFFTGDGRVAIDNNRVERQMRCVAVGRKNWLFAGSEEGGRRAAAIYSLVCTCGLLGIEPCGGGGRPQSWRQIRPVK